MLWVALARDTSPCFRFKQWQLLALDFDCDNFNLLHFNRILMNAGRSSFWVAIERLIDGLLLAWLSLARLSISFFLVLAQFIDGAVKLRLDGVW